MPLPNLTLGLPLLGLASLWLVPALHAEVSMQGSPDELKALVEKGQKQVTLRGAASMTVEATEIKAQVRITSEASTPSAALALHEQQRDDLLARLQALGIPRGQVTVPKFATISPRFGAGDRPIAHVAESTLSVPIADQKLYLDLVSVLDQSRNARLEGLLYNHGQLTNLQKQVALNACKRVTARKEAFEEGLGVTLKALAFVDETPPVKQDFAAGSQFGQIAIQSSLSVTYEVVPGAPAGIKPAAAP